MEDSNMVNSNSNYEVSDQSAKKQDLPPMMAYQMVFPEIFYKLQPYVLMVCDRLDSFGSTMPSQDMIDNICDGIYDDVCKRDPELARYLQSQVKDDPDPVIQAARFGDAPPFFGWRFRRRGLPRDLIEILLLSELFRRRRRRY